MKHLRNIFAAMVLASSSALAQTVPNGTVTTGTTWSAAQWNSAWQSKQDLIISGDCSIIAGAITCTQTNGMALTSAATTAIGTGGAAIPLLSGANGWGGYQTFSGGATVAGPGLTVSGLSSGAIEYVTAPSGTSRSTAYQSVVSGTAYNRWVFAVDSSSEAGSNAGSNFEIGRYNDAGTWVDNPLAITRSSGLVTIGDGLTVSGQVNTLSRIQSNGLGNIGQFEFPNGSGSSWYNAGWRNDGTSIFLLSSSVQTTQAAAQTAAWNSFRPLQYSLGNGQLVVDATGAGTTIGASGGTLTVNSTATFNNQAATFTAGLTANVSATFTAGMTASPRTYAALAACSSSTKGSINFITDGPAAPTWHQSVTAGGGSTPMFLGCNGANWTVMDY